LQRSFRHAFFGRIIRLSGIAPDTQQVYFELMSRESLS